MMMAKHYNNSQVKKSNACARNRTLDGNNMSNNNDYDPTPAMC